MVRNYVPRGGPKQPKSYTENDLQQAIRRVNEGEPCKRVARLLRIPHRTLRNHLAGVRKTTSSIAGRQKALLPEEELTIAQHIATFADFGYAFERIDLKLFVQSFLNKAGRNCPYFKENMPGDEWVRSFLDRHKDLLSNRACQNISKKRAAVSCEAVNRFFNNLTNTLAGVPPENVINYDETNLTDDPKAKLMIFRKGTKHAERIMNTSKSSVSIMFACSAKGTFLPPYTVYKAERIMDTWVIGGPIGARYNRTKSGWFDGFCFRDWLVRIAVPYFRRLDNDAPRVLIGDNLACHLSADTVEICEDNNIKLVFLPPNSTHLLQPLDVAVYAPMKAEWRKVLTEWKVDEGRFHTTLPKNVFPRLLFKLMINMDRKEDFAINGFKTTGIHPLNRQKVIDKLTRKDLSPSQHLVNSMVLQRLTELREASAKKPGSIQRGKAVLVSPGKSVSMDDIAAGPSGYKSQSKGSAKRKLPIESSDDSSSSEDDDLDMLLISEDEPEPDATPEGSQEEDGSTGEVEEGSYVIVRFPGKKAPYHYVGKCEKKEGENEWNIRYFRRNFDMSSPDFISFKDPQNPDLYVTDTQSIVKHLPFPLFEKNKLFFKKKDMGDFIDKSMR